MTVKQVKSMKAMQELQPKMKKLQDKFKNDPKRLQQEMGMLYKNAGVNPLAGCLPLLAQMPILMASVSFAGLIPVGGDATKAVGKICKYVAKNADNAPKIAELLAFLNKHFPDIAKALGKSDDFIDVAKQLSKASYHLLFSCKADHRETCRCKTYSGSP